MIDKNNILESGILERYLLGDLSEKEMIEVNTYIQADSKLKEQYDLLQNDFERMARENAIIPPAIVQSQLLEKLQPSVLGAQHPQEVKLGNIKTYLGIAASLAFVLGLTCLWLFNKLNTTQENFEMVQLEKTEIDASMEQLLINYEDLASEYAIINDPNATPWVLTGNQKAPNARAICYLNPKDKTAFINASGLPELAASRDYQLWADVNGVMINMGVIDRKSGLLAMNYIEQTESLNITIEPKGGSDHPTVSNLISNVYL